MTSKLHQCQAATKKYRQCKNLAKYPVAGSGSSKLTRCKLHQDDLLAFNEGPPKSKHHGSPRKNRGVSKQEFSDTESDTSVSSSTSDGETSEPEYSQPQDERVINAIELLSSHMAGLLSKDKAKRLRNRIESTLGPDPQWSEDSDSDSDWEVSIKKKKSKGDKKKNQKKKAKKQEQKRKQRR